MARSGPGAGRRTAAVGGILVAFRYLTVVPLPRSRTPGDLGRAAGWFPVVGLALGGCLALASLGLDRLVPPAVAGMLLVALWSVLTGGLHLDGLADTADGLGGGWSRERALAIMRDGRSGPYGVTAIVLVLGFKAATLASLPEGLVWRALLLAPGARSGRPAAPGAALPAGPAGGGGSRGRGRRALAGASWPAGSSRPSCPSRRSARGACCRSARPASLAWGWPHTSGAGSAGSPATRWGRSSRRPRPASSPWR